MHRKQFAELASRAQSGDNTSLEKLLLLAYSPVVYQCRKLLQNDQAAEKLAKEILQRIPSQLHNLNNPALFEQWLGNLTAKHCMRALRKEATQKNPSSQKLHIPGKSLDEPETALVVDQIVDALPDKLRICITLYCCKIPVNGIARLTDFAESDVKKYLSQAQTLVNAQMEKLAAHGVQFAAVTSLPDLLQIAMYTPKSRKSASAVVGGILGKQAAAAPVPKQAGTAPVLKIAVVTASVLLVLLLGMIFFLERNRQETLATENTTAATDATTIPTETTLCTTTAETTLETTTETTVETTVETTTETTEATTETITAPTTEPAPQVPQSSQTTSGSSTGSTTGSKPSSSNDGNAASGSAGNTSTSAGGNHVHSYQDAGPIGVNPAGCESPGSRLKICFVCGDKVRYVDEVGLPPHGHSYSSKVKAPTEGSEGFTIHTCTRCGKTYMDNYVPKLPAATQAPATQAPPAPEPEAAPNPAPDAAPESE